MNERGGREGGGGAGAGEGGREMRLGFRWG